MTLSISAGADSEMKPCPLNLPKSVGVWTRPDTARIIDSSNIFDYMNGGGELYLAYRFNHMKLYRYTAENQPIIMVEIYCMKEPDDAFGLLSLDWGGDPFELGGTPPGDSAGAIAPTGRALYGRGLLRIASDTMYARILASRETPESKEAVLTLGRAIIASRTNPPEPTILQVFPSTIGSGWRLRRDRVGFFRSHMVLNSLYYLSHENILNLDHTAEAVTAPYEKTDAIQGNERVQVLVVKYAEAGGERKALELFQEAYLPDKQVDATNFQETEREGYHEVEDGWLGYGIADKLLALVFSCPDRETAQVIINGIQLKAIAGQ
jgi:Family of unknown function (DUF6599)